MSEKDEIKVHVKNNDGDVNSVLNVNDLTPWNNMNFLDAARETESIFMTGDESMKVICLNVENAVDVVTANRDVQNNEDEKDFENRFWPVHYGCGDDENQYDIDLNNPRFDEWNDISVKHMAMASSGYNGEIIQKKARELLKQFCGWMTTTDHSYFSNVNWSYDKFEELWETHTVGKHDEKNVELFMGPICDALNSTWDENHNIMRKTDEIILYLNTKYSDVIKEPLCVGDSDCADKIEKIILHIKDNYPEDLEELKKILTSEVKGQSIEEIFSMM